MTDEPTVTSGTRIELHETVVHRVEGRPPLLGCLHARRFMEVDDDTLEAIDALREAGTVAEAERRLLARKGEEWDLLDVAQRLLRRGFVRSLDGTPTEPTPGVGRHRVLSAVPAWAFSWLRSPAHLVAGILLLAGWVALLVLDPGLRPSIYDAFVFERPGLVTIALFGGLMAMAYLHELAHYFTARSYGVDPKIRVSHRFLLLTLETDVTNAWLLPRRAQLHIFLAGIWFNLTLSAFLTFLLAASATGVLPLGAWEGWLRFLVLLNILPLTLQLMFFARTDLYYVLLVLTGERNLAGDARSYVDLQWRRLKAWTRRKPTAPCPSCGRGVWPEEPFCARCGVRLPVTDPNLYPLAYASRRRLASFAVVLVLGQVLAITYLLSYGVRLALLQLESGYVHARASWIFEDYAGSAEGALVVLVAGGQLGLMGYFLIGSTWGKLRPRLAKRLRTWRST